MLNIDYLNLKALKKRISYFILKGEILDVILKLHILLKKALAEHY
jgi:hypothetical protein